MPEAIVAHIDDLQDGEMKQVSVGDTDVLLARIDGAYHALHAYCTHYGAPLAKGALSGDRVICPWHHACFHLKTGDQLEPPGRDSLPPFDVRIENADVIVSVPDEAPERRTPEMARWDATADTRTFVVLGGGAAGMYAVEAIREAGFRGRVCMITREPYMPYDRPNCSKDYLQGEAPEEWMVFRDEAFYKAHDIEVLRNREVTAVFADERMIMFAQDKTMTYDRLILCTGGEPRRLDVPGSNLDGIHTLRSYDDSKRLLKLGQAAEQVVVVGASFIGMEVAFSLTRLDCAVTVVAPEDIPFEKPFGPRVGQMIRDLHEENGVQFRLGHTVQRFEGSDGVERVVLDDGSVLETDLVVIGIGVKPATDMMHGVALADDGSIEVDDHLQAAPGLYATGDIARFPDWRTGRKIRIEHWRLACQHGRLAGYNAAGRDVPYRSIPFFWTAHFGLNLRYVGHTSGWDDILYDGDPADRTFIAYYVEDGAVRAACGAGRDTEMAAFEELMRRDLLPSPDAFRNGPIDLVERLRHADDR